MNIEHEINPMIVARVTLISGWYVDGSGGLLFWAGVNGTSE